MSYGTIPYGTGTAGAYPSSTPCHTDRMILRHPPLDQVTAR